MTKKKNCHKVSGLNKVGENLNDAISTRTFSICDFFKTYKSEIQRTCNNQSY